MLWGIYNVLKLNIVACDHDFIIGQIKERIKQRKSFLISPLASQTFVLAFMDKKLKKVLDNYDYLFSDSLWVKRTMNFLYNNLRLKDRIRGSNLMLNVCEIAEKEGFKTFLYGTTEHTLLALREKLYQLYPRLNIVASLPSKFRELTFEEKQELIDAIEENRTDILLIALGSPLEQAFSYGLLSRNPKLNRPVIVIPVGAAFDFISGVKPTAPLWIQRLGLEWLFRFICEPRRLWKRYFIYGPLFILLVLLQKIQISFNLTHKVVGKSEVRG